MTARTAAASAIAGRYALIQRLLDPKDVRGRLEIARPFAAYPLAYLDPRLFGLADFYEASNEDRWGLVMHSKGGLGTSLFTMGDAELVGAILKLHPGHQQSFLTAPTQHVDTLLSTHNLWRPATMLRMQLDRDRFTPPASIANVRRLAESDATELNRLYAIEGDGLHYSGRQVAEGVYFGAFVRNRLVAAAGTHIHSMREGVGVVGNVFTHPDHRSKGYGTAVTAAVCAHLATACDLIVLNVDPANRTARHIYENLGFVETGRLIEAMCTRRDGFSARPFVSRLIGRWRARPSQGVEAVPF